MSFPSPELGVAEKISWFGFISIFAFPVLKNG